MGRERIWLGRIRRQQHRAICRLDSADAIHGEGWKISSVNRYKRNMPKKNRVATHDTSKPAAHTTIAVQGARVHNLKNISLEIPRDSLIVVTGLSGSGKSSLAFDTIYAEGQRRYVESLSAYARQFLDQMERPEVDSIDGLSPSIAIEQKTTT